jgi:hypothetical protein
VFLKQITEGFASAKQGTSVSACLPYEFFTKRGVVMETRINGLMDCVATIDDDQIESGALQLDTSAPSVAGPGRCSACDCRGFKPTGRKDDICGTCGHYWQVHK